MIPLEKIWSDGPLLIGVVHLPPLPGSPRWAGASLEAICDTASEDATRLVEAGFDGYIIENFGDVPFYKDSVPPHVLTCMTRIALALPGKATLRGVNVLRNDSLGALAVAAGSGLQFIRVNVHTSAMVTDQGLIEGRAAELLRARGELAPGVAIFADVNVKHATSLGSEFDLARAAQETAYRGLADALIVTGTATGSPVDVDELRRVREAVPDRPLMIGSGVKVENVADVISLAQGIIIGSSLKRDGRVENPIDAERAHRFVERVRG